MGVTKGYGLGERARIGRSELDASRLISAHTKMALGLARTLRVKITLLHDTLFSAKLFVAHSLQDLDVFPEVAFRKSCDDVATAGHENYS